MPKCEGGCQRYVDEYYQMPDLKIFCYDCWRQGKQLAENQYMQSVVRNDKIFQQNMFERERLKNELGRRVEQLKKAINLEKEKTAREWNDFGNDSSRRPYNYAEVRLMEDELRNTRNRLMNINSELPPLPRQSKFNVEYYTKATYHAKTQFSNTTNWSAIDAEIKRAAERGKRKKDQEERQIKEINDGKISNEELNEYKELVSKNLKRITNQEVLVWLAKETTSTSDTKKLLKMDDCIKLALISNPTLSPLVLKQLADDANPKVRNSAAIVLRQKLEEQKKNCLDMINQKKSDIEELQDRLIVARKAQELFIGIVEPLFAIEPYKEFCTYTNYNCNPPEKEEFFSTDILFHKYNSTLPYFEKVKNAANKTNEHLKQVDDCIVMLARLAHDATEAKDSDEINKIRKEINSIKLYRTIKIDKKTIEECCYHTKQYIKDAVQLELKEKRPFPGFFLAIGERMRWFSAQRRIRKKNKKLISTACEVEKQISAHN